MFVEVSKRFTINTQHILYIDKGEKMWTLHMTDGKTIHADGEGRGKLEQALASSPR